jgi:hypothetical protein
MPAPREDPHALLALGNPIGAFRKKKHIAEVVHEAS